MIIYHGRDNEKEATSQKDAIQRPSVRRTAWKTDDAEIFGWTHLEPNKITCPPIDD